MTTTDIDQLRKSTEAAMQCADLVWDHAPAWTNESAVLPSVRVIEGRLSDRRRSEVVGPCVTELAFWQYACYRAANWALAGFAVLLLA